MIPASISEFFRPHSDRNFICAGSRYDGYIYIRTCKRVESVRWRQLYGSNPVVLRHHVFWYGITVNLLPEFHSPDSRRRPVVSQYFTLVCSWDRAVIHQKEILYKNADLVRDASFGVSVHSAYDQCIL